MSGFSGAGFLVPFDASLFAWRVSGLGFMGRVTKRNYHRAKVIEHTYCHSLRQKRADAAMFLSMRRRSTRTATSGQLRTKYAPRAPLLRCDRLAEPSPPPEQAAWACMLCRNRFVDARLRCLTVAHGAVWCVSVGLIASLAQQLVEAAGPRAIPVWHWIGAGVECPRSSATIR
jgi:hypothetical protein